LSIVDFEDVIAKDEDTKEYTCMCIGSSSGAAALIE